MKTILGIEGLIPNLPLRVFVEFLVQKGFEIKKANPNYKVGQDYPSEYYQDVNTLEVLMEFRDTINISSVFPSEKENPEGLHFRYTIYKVDGTPVDPKAEYFILRLDNHGKDPKHIAACRKAIFTYADEIKDHLPKLSQDLMERYGSGELTDSDRQYPTPLKDGLITHYEDGTELRGTWSSRLEEWRRLNLHRIRKGN